MAGYRKLGRTASQRKALLRNQVTNLLYHGKIQTTEAKAKEIRRIAEKLITLAVKEKDNFDEVTVTAKVAKKDSDGKRVKNVVDGKKVTVFGNQKGLQISYAKVFGSTMNEVEKTIKKDQPSRLNARRKMLSYFYPVVEAPVNGRKKKANTKNIDMANHMFEEVAPKYADRNGGYTRMIKIGARRGDGAEVVIIELV